MSERAVTEKRKICMLGASGVGKTSLVTRFVHRIFSDAYRTTIGVTIEKKRVRCGEREIDLVLWDLSGEDEFQSVSLAYTRGASGLLVVIDGTRRPTVDVGLRLKDAARAVAGGVPCILVLNKADLVATWELDDDTLGALRRVDCGLVETSAKTGVGVEEAFYALTHTMLDGPQRNGRSAP
jgi:small GTP-binding protein